MNHYHDYVFIALYCILSCFDLFEDQTTDTHDNCLCVKRQRYYQRENIVVPFILLIDSVQFFVQTVISVIVCFFQETYDRLRTLSYYDTDVFIVCFSVEDPDSFENVRSKWVAEIKQYRPNTPFLLVGTQTDLRGSVVDLTDECITAGRGKKAAKRLGAVGYLECSALEGSGLDTVFRTALMAVIAPKKRWHFWKSFRGVFKRKVKEEQSV